MAIDTNFFKASLEKKFIELLDSERGIQSKLSKSIGKSASYFSEIKRGKPVNALHLKAVETVFGREVLLGLLSIDTFRATGTDGGRKDFFELGEDVTHSELVEYFEQGELAKAINWDMIRLEKYDRSALEELHEIIKIKLKIREAKELSNSKGLASGGKAVNDRR